MPSRTYELIGHESAEKQFIDAWQLDRMPHAWLISGLEGIGKATLAYRIARFVLKADNKETTHHASLFGDNGEEVLSQLSISKCLSHCKQNRGRCTSRFKGIRTGLDQPQDWQGITENCD